VGLVYRKVQVANPLRPAKTAVVECLVDTGALYSYLPAPLLRRIGVRPLGRDAFELADGRSVRREVGEAAFRIDGRVRVSPVIFGRATDEPLLGVVTLESLGLAVDPTTGALRRARLLLKKLGLVTARLSPHGVHVRHRT
jgi:clan AA aspartic protease